MLALLVSAIFAPVISTALFGTALVRKQEAAPPEVQAVAKIHAAPVVLVAARLVPKTPPKPTPDPMKEILRKYGER